jgi:hypothetical protein
MYHFKRYFFIQTIHKSEQDVAAARLSPQKKKMPTKQRAF